MQCDSRDSFFQDVKYAFSIQVTIVSKNKLDCVSTEKYNLCNDDNDDDNDDDDDDKNDENDDMEQTTLMNTKTTLMNTKTTLMNNEIMRMATIIMTTTVITF